MLRVSRSRLDAAVDAVINLAVASRNIRGFLIKFPLERQQAENLILGALSIVAPGGGPVTAEDVHFISMGGGNMVSWPP